MASGDHMFTFEANDGHPPDSNDTPADLVAVNGTPLIAFDTATQEFWEFGGILLPNYDGGGLTFSIRWAAESAVTADGTEVIWGLAFQYVEADANPISTNFTYVYNQNASPGTQPPSVVDETVHSAITFTNGADMDSVPAGGSFTLSLTRVTGDSDDDMANDAYMHKIYCTET